MANTLTGLIPILYESGDIVSRELTGLIPAVQKNTAATRAALNETVRVPVTAAASSSSNFTPAATVPDVGDATVGYTDITITKSKYQPVRWSGEDEKALRNGGVYEVIMRDRFTQAMRALTNEIEVDIWQAGYLGASRAYGTAGTTPFASDLSASAQALKILKDNGAPGQDLQLVIDTAAGANLRTIGQLTKANEAATTGTLRQGVLLDVHGFAIRESGQIGAVTKGTGASATTNTTGYAVGATTITLASAGTGTILAGDAITFAGDTNVYIVASGDADVSNGGTITLAAPGLRKAIGTSATAITVVNTSTRNLFFDKYALQLVAREPAIPSGGDVADDQMTIVDPVSGLPFMVRAYRQFGQTLYTVHMAWGVKALKAEHIGVLLG